MRAPAVRRCDVLLADRFVDTTPARKRCAGFLASVDRYMNLQLASTEEWVDGAFSGNLGEVLIRCVSRARRICRSCFRCPAGAPEPLNSLRGVAQVQQRTVHPRRARRGLKSI